MQLSLYEKNVCNYVKCSRETKTVANSKKKAIFTFSVLIVELDHKIRCKFRYQISKKRERKKAQTKFKYRCSERE